MYQQQQTQGQSGQVMYYDPNQTNADGKKVVGTWTGPWKKTKMNGKGRFTFYTGDVFDGDVVDDKRHGKGIEYSANGDKYEGDWYNDMKHGYGKETYARGDRYEGQFASGKKGGFGKYYYANGDIYEGEYVDGQMSGKGRYYYPAGNKYEGTFKDNFALQGKLYDAQGRHENTYIRGKTDVNMNQSSNQIFR